MLKDYLVALLNRAESGCCDDTDMLEQYGENEMEAIISGFWMTIEEEYIMTEEDEKEFIRKLVKNILENSDL